MTTFEEMEIIAPIQRALSDEEYVQPTPVQQATIVPAIQGHDILGCAPTGTGKTAAFAIPILDYLGSEKPRALPKRPAALVLAPTRELAIQIGDSFRVYGRHVRFRQTLVYGGVGQGKQVADLRQGVHVLVATPGRLIDLMEQGHVNLSEIEIFVLDEADRMMDMGFLPALRKIISKLPEERQSLFFSATLPPKIKNFASGLLYSPVSVDVSPKEVSVKGIDQRIRLIERSDKIKALGKILNKSSVGQAIVFTRTKHGANGLVRKLDRLDISATAIHGNKTQGARQRALKEFRDYKIKVLVATDVAARGIDVDGVTHVINYDMPVEPESYVHRIGRTGRAGATGMAISFCTQDEIAELHAIEKLLGESIAVDNPDLFDSTAPARKKAGKSSGGRAGKRQSDGKSGPKRSGRRRKQKGSTSGKAAIADKSGFRYRKTKKKNVSKKAGGKKKKKSTTVTV